MGQYAQAAVLAFAIALLALIGSIHQPGRWVVVALVSVCVATWGIASVLFPEDPTSAGVLGGTLALVGASAYLAVTAVRSSAVTEA